MRVRFAGALVGSVCVALFAATVGAQVILGPGNQYGVPGETVEFHFSVAGPTAPYVAMAQFVMAYDPAGSVFDPVADASGVVDCAMTPDLAGRMAPGPVMSLPEHGRISVTFGVTGAPVEPLGRDGVVMTCRFNIRPDAVPGVHPLVCVDAPPASTERGTEMPTTCVNGTLTVEGAGEARAAAPVGGRLAAGGGAVQAPVVGEAVVAGGAAAGAAAAGGQAPAAGGTTKGAPAGATAPEARAPQAPALGAGETGAAPALPQEPAGVATALRATAETPKGGPAAPTAGATAGAATPVPAATRAPAKKSPAAAAAAGKAQQAAPAPTVKESGCAVSPQNEGGWGWVPAIPLVALLLMRRRRR